MEKTFNMDQHEPGQITREFVLDNVDDLLIFRFYLGNFALGKKVKSPLRTGGHMSISLGNKDSELSLRYKDWVTGEAGDCFKLVAKLRNLTYPEAIRQVACDFGLVKGCSIVTKKQLEEAREFKEQAQAEVIIDVSVRSMTQPELDYWRQYGISRQELTANFIYAIDKLWVNKKQFFLRAGLHYAYHFPDVNKFKIYSPLNQEAKWFGNVSAFTIEGIDKASFNKLPSNGNYMEPVNGDPIIITKSRKDRIILKKLYPNVVNCQNEAETAIPKEMDDVFNMCESKFIWFDTDEPGKTACKKLNSRGYKWINVPNKYYDELGLKDPGDVIKYFGWEEGSRILINELKKKGIL